MNKRIIVYLLFMMMAILFAQSMNEMIVLKQAVFRPDQIISNSHKDRMGRVCAGILIYTDLTGLSFDSNNGIVNLIQQPGSYLVLVSEGERVLYIFREGYRPLEIVLYQYGISGLKSAQVYQLDISSKDKSSVKTLPVVFTVTPTDAKIRVGSQEFESGKPQSLPVGKNEVLIEKEGYRTIIQNIQVNEKSILFNYNLQKIEPVLVRFTSQPEDATIFINDVERGKTPRDIWLFPGMYELRLIKHPYSVVIEDISINENQKNQFNYTLKRNLGVIEFSVSPTNAEIYVNHEKIPRIMKIEVPPGKYNIEVKHNNYHSQYETIFIEKETYIKKSYSLKPKTGNILLSVSPLNAKTEIFREGILVNSFTGSGRISDLITGNYALRTSTQGFITKETRLHLNENENLSVIIELEKGQNNLNNMVFVEGGVFHNGVSNVRVNNFYIGTYEVTQKEWAEIMGYNPSNWKANNLPVENISWYEAIEFCNKLSHQENLNPVYAINDNSVVVNWNANGYRLPTEAEWEFAARGGKFADSSDFSGSNKIETVAWFNKNSKRKTQAVGTKLPNLLNIFDMSGNVFEWCWDWYGEYPGFAQVNPKGSANGEKKIIRGGAWISDKQFCKIDSRSSEFPETKGYLIGFRIVRNDFRQPKAN